MDEDAFFAKVVEASGYYEPKVVKSVYNGIVRTVFEELLEHGGVSLPMLADIYLAQAKARHHRWSKEKTVKIMTPRHQVRMSTKRNVKTYFRTIEDLDPKKLIDPLVRAGTITRYSSNV